MVGEEMNLIEQFGGYEKAKIASMSQIGLKKHREELLEALLQYRREHNIFEVGDRIVYPWLDDKIHVYDENYIIKSPHRHAKDEEIQAGRRL